MPSLRSGRQLFSHGKLKVITQPVQCQPWTMKGDICFVLTSVLLFLQLPEKPKLPANFEKLELVLHHSKYFPWKSAPTNQLIFNQTQVADSRQQAGWLHRDFLLLCTSKNFVCPCQIFKILPTASATPQPLCRHTYGINFKMIHHLVIELLHSQDIQKTWPRVQDHWDLNSFEIFSRYT